MLTKSQAKYIQSLGQKKHRDERDVFIAEGPKIIAEMLADAEVRHIYALREWIEANKELSATADVTEISPAELERISQLSTPNQALALVKKFDAFPSIATKDKITLLLDAIRDPGNLGTIIRIADWFGVQQVVCSVDCTDCYNPKVVQASMGSLARVKLFYTDIEEWLSAQHDVPVYAAMMEGEDITQMKKPGEGIIIIGNEARGISPAIVEKVNMKITIPQKGKAESLNAAVAAGIILSHLT